MKAAQVPLWDDLPRRAQASANEQQARDILAALWPRVVPRIGQRMTLSAWRGRNKRAALDMAEAGLTAAEVVAAHRDMCDERGDTIYTLAYLHDFIVRGPRRPKCKPGESVFYDDDGYAIVGNTCDPLPLCELSEPEKQ